MYVINFPYILKSASSNPECARVSNDFIRFINLVRFYKSACVARMFSLVKLKIDTMMINIKIFLVIFRNYCTSFNNKELFKILYGIWSVSSFIYFHYYFRSKKTSPFYSALDTHSFFFRNKKKINLCVNDLKKKINKK